MAEIVKLAAIEQPQPKPPQCTSVRLTRLNALMARINAHQTAFRTLNMTEPAATMRMVGSEIKHLIEHHDASAETIMRGPLAEDY